MKRKLILPFLLLGAFIFNGCQKQDLKKSDATAESTVSQKAEKSIGIFNMDENARSFTTITLASLQAMNKNSAVASKSSNSSANGHFTTQLPGGNAFTVSVMQNNSGVHGMMKLSGGNLGTIKMNAVCIEVVDNRATIGGQITGINSFLTEVIGIDVGDYLYFCLEDNGEGSNAPSDRYQRILYFSFEEEGPLCFEIPPGPDHWPEEFWANTANPSDQIQIQ